MKNRTFSKYFNNFVILQLFLPPTHNFLKTEMTLNSKYKAYTNSIVHSFSKESIVQQF